ncbi:outer membrane beta-barrel protein [Pontibacter sp. JH31]|uniref:Outer membrane beta-barrel protein n=1 Tax=Pontibacter aquaedesilientis TaxID=2766980 RepID=A0ABR7XJ74_9BACT|nr:outer membrane beta-barrel protein [Pontibacter aquaedesilientis]MBD1397981.1 outer membrane beta-barrel protein [Pontibacter aquaedesilientis]
MSSANNQKRHTLEEEFQRRLFDAEANPAPDLWARIDHDLTVQENKGYKKSAQFYRQLAAACFVLFALTGSLLAFYYNRNLPMGASPQGIAARPEAGQASLAPVTPEAAMQAYLEQRAEPAGAAQPQTAQAIPKPGTRGVAGSEARHSAQAVAITGGQGEMGTYYNAGAGYSPFLGYSVAPTARQGKGFVSGGVPGSIGSGINGPWATSGNRYSQIISWERITITFGIESNAGQSVPQRNSGLAAESRSFVEMSEQQNAVRQQQSQQQATVLASTLNKESDKAAAHNSRDNRWSLSLAYAPGYFEQNIGLPEPSRVSSSRMGIASSSSDVNASQESFRNMSAARNEYQDMTAPAFSYTMEVKTGFKLKEKLKLLTGIGYSENTARTKSNYVVRQFWFKPRTKEQFEMSPSTIFLSSLKNDFASDSISVARTGEAFDVDYKYRYLSIPVGLQYEHGIARDWFVYVAGGVAANFMLESSVSASTNEVQAVNYSPKDEESPFRQVQMSGNASVGIGKRLTPNLTLALGPEVRNYFSTLVADPENAMAPQGRPYALGLNVALNYQLGAGRK